MAYIERDQMEAQKYIQKTREYLDYVEEHIENVRKAFIAVSDACNGMAWVGDDYAWHTIRRDVELHDISKLSAQEFTQYRNSFYPVEGETVDKESFNGAWEHHKANNSHHHEVANNWADIVHMVIDWTAMGYKFGDTAQAYYEANKDRIKLTSEHVTFMYEIFGKIADANPAKAQHDIREKS